MRVRSNSYLIDGQDSYYVSTGGLLQPMNNPDIVSEVRFITNQFLAEFGRSAGSVMTRSADVAAMRSLMSCWRFIYSIEYAC